MDEPVRTFSCATSSPSLTTRRRTDNQKHSPTQNLQALSEHSLYVLRQHLSNQPVILSTSSSTETSDHAKAIKNETPDYKTIGLGSCGSVFEIPRTEVALKKGKDTDSLWNDFLLTNSVHNAISDTQEMMQDAFLENTLPQAPHCSFFRLPTSQQYWATHIQKFPPSHRAPGAVFGVDRIFPVPSSVREALIDLYFDDEIKQKAKHDEENEPCLIRIYLGENEKGTERYDSLRNFPMRLNMIKNLGLDRTILADEMAIALATIHWQAQIDAMDAEFVLGSARPTPLVKRRRTQHLPNNESPHDYNHISFTYRPIHIWTLDFDKSHRIDLTTADVKKYLVPAFLGNDPYYPRPDVDAEMWMRFSETYLKASRLVLENRLVSEQIMGLPGLFLEKVTEMIKEVEDWDPEESIVFG